MPTRPLSAVFPAIAASPTASEWLALQVHRQLSPRSVDAYGRGLEDWLLFCQSQRPAIDPVQATRADLGRYVDDLSKRPSKRRGGNVVQIETGGGLSHQTIQLRLTAVRLYYDHLIESGLRRGNPVGRGRYSPKRHDDRHRQADTSARPLLKRRRQKLPWIPNDQEFLRLLRSLRDETPRNRALLMLMYDGALRREETVGIEVSDIDWPHRELMLRPETCKNDSGRLVLFTKPTALALNTYLEQRRKQKTPRSAPMFLSESNRNKAGAITPDSINKLLVAVRQRACLPKLHPHTLRHLRLTHMARAGIAEQVIAEYAGHRSIETTRIYIHLSGREIGAAVARKMEDFDRWIERSLAEAHS